MNRANEEGSSNCNTEFMSKDRWFLTIALNEKMLASSIWNLFKLRLTSIRNIPAQSPTTIKWTSCCTVTRLMKLKLLRATMHVVLRFGQSEVSCDQLKQLKRDRIPARDAFITFLQSRQLNDRYSPKDEI